MSVSGTVIGIASGAARRLCPLLLALTASALLPSSSPALPFAPRLQLTPGANPIQHIVVIFQENHSFDETLGAICIQDNRCNSTSTGKVSTGEVIPLRQALDVEPNVLHSYGAQTQGIHGGTMDGFDLIRGCSKDTGYACYSQYEPSQIPNLAALARAFVISDRTFENGAMPSWGSHLVLVTATQTGFRGDNPKPGLHVPGPGWGCDSFKDTLWLPPGGGPPLRVPSCVPKPDGTGPYRASPVKWVPTIMDWMDAADLTWQIDAARGGGWSICPTFADCLYTDQKNHVKYSTQVLTDATNGTLPNLSLVIPCCGNSQHNGHSSMIQGDTWIGQVVGALMNGPQWSSTAIFITYDDCGCFYDHVTPPPGMGIRLPMVIVSPWAKPGYTDSSTASYASMLAFAEHTFGLPPLGGTDVGAYDYSDSFDFSQKPIAPIPMVRNEPSAAEKAWLEAHPPDPDDPT